MTTLLSSPDQWAQTEFGFAQLGDKRRNRRLVKIAEHLAAQPSGSLPQAFERWAELKAAYRFFSQQGVCPERILAPHAERTRRACRQSGEYLLIEDSTLLDYTDHRATEDLGIIGDNRQRGFELHTTLAVRVQSWTLEQRPEGELMGLVEQQCRRPRPVPRGETRVQRLKRPRKSQKWTVALKGMGRAPRGAQWIYIADREADCYETLQTCRQHGVDFIVRACQDRRLDAQAGHLFAAVAQAPTIGRYRVEVRSRAGQPARTALVEVRMAEVGIQAPYRPGGFQAPLQGVRVVEVKENDAPEGIKEPLHWILLSSLACGTWAEVQRIIGRYCARWWIEEYHKALKSGTGVEQSQLERADRLEGLIAVLAIVAVRLLSTKLMARSRPESFEAANSFGPELLALLEKKLGPPKGGWTNQHLITAIARVGGFLARKHDGQPGWQTIWRGWQRLIWMCEGTHLIQL